MATGVHRWLLLRLNRLLLTGAILSVIFVVLVGSSQLGLSPLRSIVTDQDGLHFLFSSFIGAIITGTSIVVTINQLVLSQELGAVGDQRERMQQSLEFRSDVEDTIQQGTAPPEPAAFLYELVDGIEARTAELEATLGDEHDAALREQIESYVEDLAENAQSVKANLEDAQFGSFVVIWAALQFNYSRKIYDARQIQAEHAATLSTEAEDAIENTIELLALYGPAREHFKTLYFQWELINLSRMLLYLAVPALATMGLLIMYIDGSALPGTTLGIDNLVWLTSLGFVIGLSPFVVFIAYVLRIATVAKQTLAMGPFILRESEQEADLGE